MDATMRNTVNFNPVYNWPLCILLFIAVFAGCRKEDDLDDPTVYLWRIELRSNVAPDGATGATPLRGWLISTEYRHLTNREVATMKKTMKTRGLQFFTYTKVKE